MSSSSEKDGRSPRIWHLAWLGLPAALLLLIGRFDWAHGEYAWRSYVCSAYLMAILLPVTYVLLARFLHSHWLALLGGIVLGSVLALPHQWLGWRGFYRAPHAYWPWNAPGLAAPVLPWDDVQNWLAGALPYEWQFFLCLLLAGWLVIAVVQHRFRTVGWLGWIVPLLFYGLIVLQTWLHISMRSPYCYLAPYAFPPGHDGLPHWYHVYLFPNGVGAVNYDYVQFFRDLELLFLGLPHVVCDLALNRPLPYYLMAQFTWLVNPLYVMAAFNVLAWAAAVLAFYRLTATLAGRVIAIYAAAFLAMAPGFIMYAGQPPTYVWGYAVVAVVYWIFYRLFLLEQPRCSAMWLFGGVLGLALLIYDHLALLCVFPVCCLWKRRHLALCLGAVVVGLVLQRGFLLTAGLFEGYRHDGFNAHVLRRTAVIMADLVLSRRFDILYARLLQYLPQFLQNMFNAFLLLAPAAALCAWCRPENRPYRPWVLLLALPALLNFTFFHFGQYDHLPPGFFLRNFPFAKTPRLFFSAYPAIYLLTGMVCMHLHDAGRRVARRFRAPGILALGLLLAHFFVVNADVFGHPVLYLLFYFQDLP